LRLCEPCAHLARLSHQRVLPGLVHRGGLRAQILSEGLIRSGDPIREIASS
jgi:MOSC domain-containing protein YiiM